MGKIVLRLHVVCLFLATALLQACDRRPVAITLDDIETYIQTYPDSALTTLRAIDTTSLTTRSLRAQYALLHAIALDKNWIDTTDINVVMPAVQYYDKHPSDIRRPKAWYYLGRIQYNGRRYDEAILSFTRAKEYISDFDDNRFIALVREALADTYNSTYLFEEALENSGKAYDYSLRAGDSLLANAVLYNIARQHNNLREYAAADSILSFLVLPGKVNKNTIPNILADYALLNINYQKDFYKARELLNSALLTEKDLLIIGIGRHTGIVCIKPEIRKKAGRCFINLKRRACKTITFISFGKAGYQDRSTILKPPMIFWRLLRRSRLKG